ncbi:beta-ketoacyl-ACP synthase 3 [Rhodococcus sp. X156]|uniref:beta-ketoacyl-ACP synthase 3 n=1 Tax=Rhodococcus sp. X156 TaxID=2499145 RepID=UPI000FD9EA9E|nr:beta-ketoacyl-ACP synthase 3 [Rhodococcus sp. X156]
MSPALQLAAPVVGARLLGVGSYQPARVVTNDELALTIDTTDEWVRSRVGVVSRHLADPAELLVDMATSAAAAAIADAGLVPADVDTVIVATCTMPTSVPNAAARVATGLGVNGIGAFDVNAACAGFTYGLAVAADLVRSGSARTVVVVGAEKFTDWVDPQDRSTAIIFADGAGAAVIGAADAEHPAGIGPVVWGSSGDMADVISIPDRTAFLQQEGQTVFRWATTKIAPVALAAIERAGIKPGDIDVLIPHQANLRILEAIAKALRKEGARDEMVLARDIISSGNTSAASIPMALDHLRTEGTVRSGDVALLVGFGAGLCFAAQVVLLP